MMSFIYSTAVAMTKDGYLVSVRNGLYDYGSIESDAVTVRFCGEVAVQTGKVRMVVGQRDQPKAPIGLLFTLVWKREAAGWRLWQRHATHFVARSNADSKTKPARHGSLVETAQRTQEALS